MKSVELYPTPVNKTTYERAVEQCKKIALGRSHRYGNSIDIVKTPSIIDLVLMKLVRTRELSENDTKYIDEILDSINYLLYILIRKAEEKRNDS